MQQTQIKINPIIIDTYNNFMNKVNECDKILHIHLDEYGTFKY